jgi:hypothetical protein
LPSTDHLTGYDVAEMLLKKGANPNIQLKLRPPYRNGVFDRGGDQVISTGATPLLVAAKAGDFKSVALLLKYKALVDLPNSNGVTAYMVAAGVGQSANPTRGRYKTDDEAVECLKLLKVAGANPNVPSDTGLTALHAAAQLGWNSTIKTLVADGAQLEALDRNGLTPIDYALGRQPRGFLEPERARQEESYTILKDYIVASTGRAPKEFTGPAINRQTRGTGGAAPDEGGGGRRGGGGQGGAPAGGGGAPGAAPGAAGAAPAAASGNVPAGGATNAPPGAAGPSGAGGTRSPAGPAGGAKPAGGGKPAAETPPAGGAQ